MSDLDPKALEAAQETLWDQHGMAKFETWAELEDVTSKVIRAYLSALNPAAGGYISPPEIAPTSTAATTQGVLTQRDVDRIVGAIRDNVKDLLAEHRLVLAQTIRADGTSKTDATREGDSLISWLPKGEATYSKQDNGMWNVTLWERGTTNILEVLAHDMDKGVAAFMAIKVNEAIKSRTPGRMSGYINIPPQDTST